jgi:phosphoglycolate phosphatase
MTYRHVVFDFDGTLINSAPSILGCFRDVLAARGLEPKMEIDSRLIGPPLLETLARISGISVTDELSRLAEDFKRLYDEAGLFATVLYAGVEAMLADLHVAGCRLHIATNKRMRPTGLILDHLGLAQFFDSVYAIDSAVPPYASKAAMIAAQLAEQSLPAGQSCYVGDKTEDGIAAEANKLAFYAAAWGYGDWDTEMLPTHWSVVTSPSSLPACLCG